MGEKLCLVAPDMQKLMTDRLDEKSTKLCNLAIKLTFGCNLEILSPQITAQELR